MATNRRFCTNCGQQVFENSKFCGTCGSSLADDGPNPLASQPPFAPPPVNQPPPAYVPPPPPQPVYQPQQPQGFQQQSPPQQYPPVQPGYAPQQPYQGAQPGYQSSPGYPLGGYPPPPVYPAAPQPYGYAPQTGLPGETLTGIIPGASRKKNLVSAEGFNIIVTSQRMVFALMTSQMVQEEAKRNSSGKGFFGGVAAGMAAGYNLWRRYLEMPPEQALRENPENFDIHLNQIRKVKFDGGRTLLKKGPISIGLNINRDDDEPAKLEIEATSGKYKFDIASDFQGEAREILKRAGLIS